MSLSKQNRQVANALIIFILSVATWIVRINYDTRELMDAIRSLLVTASVCMLFGIFKCHPSHKAYLQLFGVCSSFIYFVFMNYITITNISHYGFGIEVEEHLSPLLLTVGGAYMTNILYKDYMELTQGPAQPVEEKPVEDEQAPPSYESNMQSVVISEKLQV